jgi:hypothetical protein
VRIATDYWKMCGANNTEKFYVVHEECTRQHVNVTPTGTVGRVRGLYSNTTTFSTEWARCTFSIVAPDNTCLVAYVHTYSFLSTHRTDLMYNFSSISEEGVLSFSSSLIPGDRLLPLGHPALANFSIVFHISEKHNCRRLPVPLLSRYSGYVTSPGFDQGLLFPPPLKPQLFEFWANISVPYGHGVVTSFEKFQWYCLNVDVYTSGGEGSPTLQWQMTEGKALTRHIPPRVYTNTTKATCPFSGHVTQGKGQC